MVGRGGALTSSLIVCGHLTASCARSSLAPWPLATFWRRAYSLRHTRDAVPEATLGKPPGQYFRERGCWFFYYKCLIFSCVFHFPPIGWRCPQNLTPEFSPWKMARGFFIPPMHQNIFWVWNFSRVFLSTTSTTMARISPSSCCTSPTPLLSCQPVAPNSEQFHPAFTVANGAWLAHRLRTQVSTWQAGTWQPTCLANCYCKCFLSVIHLWFFNTKLPDQIQ